MDPHVNIDEIASTTSEVVYTSEDGKPRIFLNATDAYNVISSTIVFGALKDNDSLNLKSYFLTEMIDYLKANSSLGLEKFEENQIQASVFPNPTSSDIRISLYLKYNDFVEIEIFNQNGKKVTTLANKNLTAGNYTFDWNLRTQNGKFAEPGVYFYRITTSYSVSSNRIIIM